MLPYTPLHDLLLDEVGGPVVATSGNVGGEPLCTDEAEAVTRLRGVADAFLVHDRAIVHRADDSVVRLVAGRELVLRRARGYAPLPIPLGHVAPPVVATGAQQNSAVAVTAGSSVFVSQHIGDLETPEAVRAFDDTLSGLRRLYPGDPVCVLADLHPDYTSARRGAALGAPVVTIQHHHAHVAACLAENALDGRVLGVAWDGTGYGPDGTIWGGELLETDGAGFVRAACLRPFRLPGGARAVREPRRSAFGVLVALDGEAGVDGDDLPPLGTFTRAERRLLHQAVIRGVNAPVTTSAGRLFDAVASLCGLCQRASFDGQAAMALESAVDASVPDVYPWRLDPQVDRHALGPWLAPGAVLDWGPALRALVADLRAGERTGVVAARFHNTLAEMVVGAAARVGLARVALTGGCFQNRYLTERCLTGLRQAGFQPYWHRRVPPNDGGVALGQVAAWMGSQGNQHVSCDSRPDPRDRG
jgi:hydrogenase maturation protein HypF